jgi:hypothetical protein
VLKKEIKWHHIIDKLRTDSIRAEMPGLNNDNRLNQYISVFLFLMARRDRGIRTPTSVTRPSTQNAYV